MRVVWGCILVVIILVQYIVFVAMQERNNRAVQAAQEDNRRYHERTMNELRALAWTSSVTPTMPQPEPWVVRPQDLVRAYRDHRTYDGVQIAVQLRPTATTARSLSWHVGSTSYPPAIEFILDDPSSVVPGDRVWVIGRCTGRIDDGSAREVPGMTYRVVVDGCRVIREK